MSQIIEIGIGNECYGIHIGDIQEIIKMQEITRLPNQSPYFKGVIHLRGHIVSVISLRARLNMIEVPYTKATRIVVLGQEGEQVGVIVDHVNRVSRYTELKDPPDNSSASHQALIHGIGTTASGFLCILNVAHIIDV